MQLRWIACALLMSGPAFGSDNPAFTEKLSNPYTYQVNREIEDSDRSICGDNDLQFVNDYDGSLGPSIEFVDAMKYSVGALTSPSDRKYCTGTLVGESLFITASHCVDSTTLGDHISFNYEYASGAKELLKEVKVGIIEVLEDGMDQRLDYAILRLATDAGKNFGWKKLNLVADNVHFLTIIQHPSGQPKQIEAGEDFWFDDTKGKVRYADIDTKGGSSGSGVMDENGHLVGVHTHAGCSQFGDGSNSGTFLHTAAKTSKYLNKISKQ